MSRTTIYGKATSTGNTLHIDQVEKELNLTFDCAECGSDLVPVKSEARKKDWHFRHKNESNLVACRRRGLHDFAQELLLESNEIQIAKSLRINYSNAKKEDSVDGLYRSDVSAIYEEAILHFEVFVTNDLKVDKAKYYDDNQIRCIKIDLSDKKYLLMSREEIVDTILNSTHNKTMYGWGGQLKDELVQDSFWKRYSVELVLGVISLLVLFIFKRRMKRRLV